MERERYSQKEKMEGSRKNSGVAEMESGDSIKGQMRENEWR